MTEEKTVPEITDGMGKLHKLKASDFPKTAEGRKAWCDYQITKWKQERKRIEKREDPFHKLRVRRERLQKQLEELDAELIEEDKPAEEE